MHCKRRLRLAKLCALISCAILTGCAQTTGSGGKIDASPLTFCQGARPILWSARDTDGTISQVKEHNAVGANACGWGR